MLIYFTDALTSNPVAVNPNLVGAVFTAHDGEFSGKTVINTQIGSVVVTQSVEDVVSVMNGDIK